VLRAFGALTGVALAAYVAHVAFGLGSPGLDELFDDYVYTGIVFAASAICLARGFAIREERAAWPVMGAGLLAWAAGEVAWTVMIASDPAPPYPSVADALYLSFYPASYTSLLLLARSRTDSFRSSLWLDGAIAALTVAAVIATLAFQPIVDATSGGPAEIAVNLAYPVGDLLLLGLVVTVFGLNGWRPDPVWLLIGVPSRQSRTGSTWSRARPTSTSRAGCSTSRGPRRRCSWPWRRGSRRGGTSRSATG
jgi:hypothetical protein